MSLAIDFPVYVIQAFLVFTRLAAFLYAGPVFFITQVNTRWKAMLIFFMTWVILPVLPESWSPSHFHGLNALELLGLVTCELLLGLAVGLIVRIMLEVLVLGGHLVDRDLGYTIAEMIDPGGVEGKSTLFSLLLTQAFLCLFLIHDAHLDFIRLMVSSFHSVPPGSFRIEAPLVNGIVELGSAMFSDGFRLAMPIFTIILILNVSMALITRFAQEFEVMFLSFPIKLGLGLFVLASMLPVYLVVSRDLIDEILANIHRMLN